MAWAAPFEKRTWVRRPASQQLVAAGEDVVDVTTSLAARVRVLTLGRSDKNDPNVARTIAALRAPRLAEGPPV